MNFTRTHALVAFLLIPSVVTAQQGRPTPAEEVPAVEVLPAPASVSQGSVSILEPDVPRSPADGDAANSDIPPAPAPMTASDSADSYLNGVPPQTQRVDAEPYEVLLRGPIHEAFAIRNVAKVATQSISAKPPANVFEVIPSAKPKGNDVQWVPGYWNYFEDAGDFVWISGFYRDVPPGRKWVEGYWLESDKGFAWISGYWGSTTASEVILPEPPANKQVVPSSTSPNQDTFWMPGEWTYKNNQYTWTPGFWTKFHDEWTWQPTYFIDTTEGHIRVAGYWDYQPKYRGVPYTPVVFGEVPNNYEFVARYSIGAPIDLMLHLFAFNDARGYYFGNYYSQEASLAGYVPWYQLTTRGFPTADFLSYFNWKYRSLGVSFSDSINRYSTYFRSNPSEYSAQVANGTVALTPSRFGRNWDTIIRTIPASESSIQKQSSTEQLLAEQRRREQSRASEYEAQLRLQQARQSGQVVDAYGRPVNPSTGIAQNNSIRRAQPQPMAQSRLPSVSERTQASRYGGTPNTLQPTTTPQPTTLRDRIRSRIIAGPTVITPTIGGRVVAPPALIPPMVPPTLVPGFVPPGLVPPGISPRIPGPGIRFGRRR